MRLLFLTLILICASCASAERRPLAVQYTYESNKVTSEEDEAACDLRARVGATSHQNALLGNSIIEQLKLWDEHIGDSEIPVDEQAKLREILIMGWSIVEGYPDVKSNDLGDMIRAQCIREKPQEEKKYRF